MRIKFYSSKPNNVFVSAMTLSLLFSAVFVGDFVVIEIYLFIPIFLIVVALRCLIGIQIQMAELLSFFIISFLYLIIMLANTPSISSYYFSLLFSLFFIFCIPVLEWLFKRSEIIYFCVGLLLVLLPFAVISIIQQDIRSSIIFGPNVYYRVIGFLYILFLLVSLWTGKLRNFRFLVLSAAIIMLLSTGSRGAAMIIALLFILYAKASITHSRSGVFQFTFLLIFLCGGFVYYSEKFFERFWRLFYFSFENASLQTRWSFLVEFNKYFETISAKDVFFGNGESQRIFVYYPHNIFIESFVYHGIFIFLIFVMYFMMLLYALFQPFDAGNRNLNLILLFSPIFLGSMVSGSFFEAYTVAAVAIFTLVRVVSSTPRLT